MNLWQPDGTCLVRVVHSWFSETDEWDDQYVGHTHGWLSFFRVLKAYLTYFAGQSGTLVPVMGTSKESKEATWHKFANALELTSTSAHTHTESQAAASPQLAGEIVWAGQPAWPQELLLHLQIPGLGLAHFVPHPMGDTVYLSLRFYFYGERAAQVAKTVREEWQAWVEKHFPTAA